jgi:hypothetical protein
MKNGLGNLHLGLQSHTCGTKCVSWGLRIWNSHVQTTVSGPAEDRGGLDLARTDLFHSKMYASCEWAAVTIKFSLG